MESMTDPRVTLPALIIGICLGIAGTLAISYFLCDINPAIDSGWLRGIWHGSNFIQNFILSLFDGRLLKAPIHSGAYSFWWWACTISSFLWWFLILRGWFYTIRNILNQ